jgi:hypothetical protein
MFASPTGVSQVFGAMGSSRNTCCMSTVDNLVDNGNFGGHFEQFDQQMGIPVDICGQLFTFVEIWTFV